MPSVIPMLSYEDGVAALEWLSSAFGFRERARMQAKDGTLTHGELEFDGGVVMLATPTPAYESPRHHRESCDAAKRWSKVPFVVDGVLVNVADVDAHFERARAAGARILSEPQDVGMGLRHYRAEDLEGHRWMFAQEVADGDRRD
jgi:uncharacterized glyoxalase superfamily protein PhnB